MLHTNTECTLDLQLSTAKNHACVLVWAVPGKDCTNHCSVYTSNGQAKAPKSPDLNETLRHFAHRHIALSHGHGSHGSHGSPWTWRRTSLRSSDDISGAEVASPGRKPSWSENPTSKASSESARGSLLTGTISPSRGLRSSILRCRMPAQFCEQHLRRVLKP